MSQRAQTDSVLVLVTGVTGYIGGRLAPELLAAGFRVRVMARRPRHLVNREWYDKVEIVEGDAADRDSLTGCLRGVDVAYFLIHSLGTGARFESRDRTNALNFAAASRTCGVSRIVYLGGLYPEAEKLSPHLESRKEVGEIFLASGVPTTVLRAAVILGSGSASFEMLRYLTERLGRHPDPAHRGQRRPALLVGSVTTPADVNRGFDIGGPEPLGRRVISTSSSARDGVRPSRRQRKQDRFGGRTLRPDRRVTPRPVICDPS